MGYISDFYTNLTNNINNNITTRRVIVFGLGVIIATRIFNFAYLAYKISTK